VAHGAISILRFRGMAKSNWKAPEAPPPGPSGHGAWGDHDGRSLPSKTARAKRRGDYVPDFIPWPPGCFENFSTAKVTGQHRALNIIMTRERISRSTRTARGLVLCSYPSRAITLLPFRRLAASIIAMSVELRKMGEKARPVPASQSPQIDF
jgi:hypothetical protein